MTGAGRPPCVLVVEDERLARDVICESLEDEGCSALAAADGAEAIRLLENDPDRLPCVILLDLMMPGMNGWEFRDWQQKSPRFAAIPVVLLSAVRGLREEASRLDASAYLEKPLRFETLMAAIEKHCGPCKKSG